VRVRGIVTAPLLLYMKMGAPADWTRPDRPGSQSREIMAWEAQGYRVSLLNLSNTQISQQLLSGYDALRLNISGRRVFSQQEALALQLWVQRGGRLFVDVPHKESVDAVAAFGVARIDGAGGGGSGLSWHYRGAPLILRDISGPVGAVARLAAESMDRPVLQATSSLNIAAKLNGYPAIVYGHFGNGRVVVTFLTNWSHDVTWPGNAHRANIKQEGNLQFLRNSISYLRN